MEIDNITNLNNLTLLDYFKSYKIKTKKYRENNESIKRIKSFSIESYSTVIENIEKEFGDSKFFNKEICLDDVNLYLIRTLIQSVNLIYMTL